MFECQKCNHKFLKFKSFLKHKLSCSPKLKKCEHCDVKFTNNRLTEHKAECKTIRALQRDLEDNSSFHLHRIAYRNVLAVYVKLGSWPSIEDLF